MFKIVKYLAVNTILHIVLIASNSLWAQTYCTPTNIGTDNAGKFFISNVNLEDINNSSTKHANDFTFYNNVSTDVYTNTSYSTSVTYDAPQNNDVYLKVWIDFNKDGDFSDSGELAYTYFGRNTSSKTSTKNFQISIPDDATIGLTRMRVALKHNYDIDPCNLNYEKGEVEDYNINIISSALPPTANCIGNLDVYLDVSGNVTIAPSDLNNGSFDDVDNANDLIFSLSKTTFSCENIGSNTVDFTVEDTDGLTDSCTATVTVFNYSGTFMTPTIPDVTEYCSYTAPAPVLDYQCGQQITGTTSDTTVFNTVGAYSIEWAFDNGSTIVYSTQDVYIIDPGTISNIAISSITETTAIVTWSSTETSTYKIKYKPTISGTWIETTSSSTTINLTGLDDGLEYEVQIAVDASCAIFDTETFTTLNVEYCTSNIHLNPDSDYYISNTAIGTINNNSTSSDPIYKYFNGIATNLTKGETFSGTVTYSRATYNTVALVVWIDFNNDGDFDDTGEEVFSQVTGSTPPTQLTATLSNIAIPTTATEGKTRMRIALKHNGTPTSACDFDYDTGEIEDYDVFIFAKDTSLYEAALFTQVYHYDTSERWIEITNTGTATIPTNTFIVALFKNKSGDQTGVSPTSTYLVNTALSAGQSVLLNSSNSILSNHLETPITDNNITDFDDANDILIITSETGTTAWENRFDVLSNISNNSSAVRSDEVLSYNNTYTASEWISFVDDDLVPYTERHPHAAVISEVDNANSSANIRLGVHNLNETTRTSNAWDNGYPDKSRSVVINQNTTLSTQLNARKLEVTSGYKLTITDNLLLVADNLTINANAEIRLAGTSQFIQTHTGSKNLNGTGKLYIDRYSDIGSKYLYNYMSSPVNNLGSNVYNAASVLKDGSTYTSANSTALNINFISGYDGSKTSPISLPNYWFYTYANGDGRSNWVQKGSTGIIPQTDGFVFKGPGVAQNYTFVGTPKDGELTTTIGGYQNYLVGNPYPSALNAKKFIEDNDSSMYGTLYFWQHAGVASSSENNNSGHNASGYIGGYATRNISMGVSADNVASNENANDYIPGIGQGTYSVPQAYIPVGQGFFISGKENGGIITFNNSQREFVTEGSESIFFKNSKKEKANKKNNFGPLTVNLPIIKLGVDYLNDDQIKMHRQIGISFKEGNSFKYDNGYDSPKFEVGKTDVYWKFSDDQKKYAITGVQEISDDLEVPIGVEMGYEGNITIAIDEWNLTDKDLILLDHETGLTYTLNKNKATINLQQKSYENRFSLAFSAKDKLSIANSVDKSLAIYYVSSSNEIVIENPNNKSISAVQLYNLLGQPIHTWEPLNTKNKLRLKANYPKGIYILKINIDNKIISEKIILK
ncbi:GEVED domain-containing protein [Flavicella sediminum]|uniref:GEVED domain-containing protein n=1 Tax=Flavicella sediminum TaxID=2585141 RepID=UPI001121CFA9|nr:GEVED domain-containing protein [Flavicella sediminum]